MNTKQKRVAIFVPLSVVNQSVHIFYLFLSVFDSI